MKLMRSLGYGFFLLVVSACGGSGDGGSSSKDLFSLWIEDGSGNPLSLVGASFNTPAPLLFVLIGGEQCSCSLTVSGSQNSGNYIVSSCAYVAGTGAGDPGCNAFNTTGSYSKSDTVLTLMPATGGSSTYR